MRTAEEFKTQAEKEKLTGWPSHNCSFCDYLVGFIFRDGRVFYDSGCGCIYAPPRATTWQEVADMYNVQDAPSVIAKMDRFWGFEPQPSTTKEGASAQD